jgi:predicted transcriptional regulator of viral defense system
MKSGRENIDYKIILKTLDDYGLDIFSTRKLAGILETGEQDIKNYLLTLVKQKIIFRIENGKFVRHNFRDNYVIGCFLASGGIISYWSALHYHGLTERFPNTVFVQADKKKANKEIFSVKYQFIKLNHTKLFGYITEGTMNHQFKITDIEKTILDCFDKPQYSGDFADLIIAISKIEIDEDRLIDYAIKLDNFAVIQRIAYIFDMAGKLKIQKFLDFAKSGLTNTYHYFDVFGEKHGKYNSKWKICYNYGEKLEEILKANY